MKKQRRYAELLGQGVRALIHETKHILSSTDMESVLLLKTVCNGDTCYSINICKDESVYITKINSGTYGRIVSNLICISENTITEVIVNNNSCKAYIKDPIDGITLDEITYTKGKEAHQN